MPFDLGWTKKGVVMSFLGVVSAEDVDLANHSFYSDSRSDGVSYQVVDFTKAEGVLFTPKDMRKVAAYDVGASRSIINTKVAIAAPDEKIKSVCQHYVDVIKNADTLWDVCMFDSLQEARNWIEG